MATCDVCGNDYDKAFQVTRGGCMIIGHGVEAGGEMYCCASCAGHQGGIRDRAA